ncbi:hypothetical protein GGS23DRAFT_217182 [Durotheca rogersii]|uniref:uncharacterized protein n=1 Tax=Durotheca rogersii TaxID=419775 RepID=UPI00221F85D2|nr:uncharacterized protein GGS23DRAFT_217182 [Durotheca rogersii]KAI5860926.1 hypothetical protein GGS23DRAFT_217182 [Durotheca rogersii]
MFLALSTEDCLVARLIRGRLPTGPLTSHSPFPPLRLSLIHWLPRCRPRHPGRRHRSLRVHVYGANVKNAIPSGPTKVVYPHNPPNSGAVHPSCSKLLRRHLSCSQIGYYANAEKSSLFSPSFAIRKPIPSIFFFLFCFLPSLEIIYHLGIS